MRLGRRRPRMALSNDLACTNTEKANERPLPVSRGGAKDLCNAQTGKQCRSWLILARHGRASSRPSTSLHLERETKAWMPATSAGMTSRDLISHQDTPPPSRDAVRPSFVILRCPSKRAQGKPGAQCTRGLACELKSTRASPPQVHRNHIRLSLRDGFNGFLRSLPGDRALLSPSPARCESIVAGLIPASGYQNATTSPSAIGAFVSCPIRVHRIPRPTSVTIAIRPSSGCGMAGILQLILLARKAKNFLAHDWTTQITLRLLANSAFWCNSGARRSQRYGRIFSRWRSR
jgi:hypothetical protein